jgi:hypothetical protein
MYVAAKDGEMRRKTVNFIKGHCGCIKKMILIRSFPDKGAINKPVM